MLAHVRGLQPLPEGARALLRDRLLERARVGIGGGSLEGLGVLQSKRLVIEARWVSKPLASAGELRPRRLNNQPF
jgi:hypothetical protein